MSFAYRTQPPQPAAQTTSKITIPQTILGDLQIDRDAISVASRKTWLPLSFLYFPSEDAERDLRANFLGLLLFELHKACSNRRRVAFTGLIDISEMTFQGRKVRPIKLVTNQAAFVDGIKATARRLLEGTPETQAAARNAVNDEFRTACAGWSVEAKARVEARLVPYRFVCDSEARTLSIAPVDRVSGIPGDYPGKASTTGELLTLLAALSQGGGSAGSSETVRHSYPLSKLFIGLAESNAIDLDKVRVNAADLEEWDYLNPDADDAFRKYGIS